MKDFSHKKGVILGKPCIHGHVHKDGLTYRHQSNSTCCECQQARILAWAKTPRGRELCAKKREKYKDKSIAKSAEYRKKNKDRLIAYNREYRDRNQEWTSNYYREYNAARRAARLRAMPAWTDRSMIAEIYKEARRFTEYCGQQYHVDHIVPLVSPLVCGLHVPWNLRIIPGSENTSKGNRWWPTD